MDEIAEKQRQREEEAEARRAALKKSGGLAPERQMSRDKPAETPSAGGPPRLALGGSKPGLTWREREALKASGQAPPAAAPAAAPTPEAPEAEAPKRGGYLPPALRARGADGSPAPGGGWREREGSGRGPAGRNESPATGGRYEASSSRGRFADLGDKGRTQSPASGGSYAPPARRGMGDGARGRETDREPRESLPPSTQGASDGKYRPGAFRRTQGQ